MIAESSGHSTERMNGTTDGFASTGAESVTNKWRNSNMTTDEQEVLPLGQLNPFMEIMNALDMHGWVKGKLGNEQEGFCIAGAYGFVATLAPEQFNTPSCRRKMALIFTEVLPKGQTIFPFNDRIAEDDLDIRECLKHAAQLWDERADV